MKPEKKSLKDDGHYRLDLKSSKFYFNYTFLAPKIKLQDFENRWCQEMHQVAGNIAA